MQITINIISINTEIIGVINKVIITAIIIKTIVVIITIKINGIKTILFKKNKEISGKRKLIIGIKLNNGQSKKRWSINP